MESKIKVMDHPLHPILVHLPIGLLIISVISDTVGLISGRGIWEDLALWDIVFGLSAMAIASIPGLIDYRRLPMNPEAARLATFHVMFNMAAFVTFTLSLVWRLTLLHGLDWSSMIRPVGPYIVSLIGMIFLLVSAFLGGQLVFKHGIGVSQISSDDSNVEVAPTSKAYASSRRF
jgi:uncharacterized membrane protein